MWFIAVGEPDLDGKVRSSKERADFLGAAVCAVVYDHIDNRVAALVRWVSDCSASGIGEA